MSRRRAPGRDRTHLTPGRPRAVLLRYTDSEYTEVADAARCAGLTPSGYAAEAALAAATRQAGPALQPERAALAELIRARGQVRKLGANVNQAARQLNAIGEAPPWLEQAVRSATRAVAELEAAATAMTTATRRRSSVRQQTSDGEPVEATSRQRTSAVNERSHGRTAPDVVPPATTGHLTRRRDENTSSGGCVSDATATNINAQTGEGERHD